MFNVGRPSMVPILVIKDVQSVLADYMNLDKIMSAGIGVYGPAAAYALVWELGSRRLKKPGPKTVWGANRKGQKVILTKQAPFGYVGISVNQFWPIIKDELEKVDFNILSGAASIVLRLQIAMDNAAHRIAKIVSDNAPVDKGQLRTEIMGIDSDETGFLNSEDDSDLEAEGVLLI